jgi:hypothetical protein
MLVLRPAGQLSWLSADLLGIDHQPALIVDKPYGGAEVVGNPSSYLARAAAIDSHFNDASAEQASAS